jgi:hypothetical protein
MPLNEFWYGEIDLLNAYVKARNEKLDYETWLSGKTMFESFSLVMANVFRGKNDKFITYPKYVPLEERTELSEKELDRGTAEEIVQNALLNCY